MIRRHMMLRSVLVILLLATAAFQVTGALTNANATPEPLAREGGLEPLEVHARTARHIVERLQGHYRQMRFDDALSEKVFERYLRDLDPNRIYFLASDIKAFERYRTVLDDQLRRGDLNAGFDMFNLYQQRVGERLEFMLARLAEGVDELDFSGDQEVKLDRSEAAWAEDAESLDDIWLRRLKNAVLTMRLDGVEDDEIGERLERRYSSQLNRIDRKSVV